MDDDYHIVPQHAYPRPKEGMYVRPKEIFKKKPWGMPLSIFKNYKPDTEDVINECFEYDWSCLKVPPLSGGEEEHADLKEAMRKGYRMIRESYKFFSAVGASNNNLCFSIPLNCFHDFMK